MHVFGQRGLRQARRDSGSQGTSRISSGGSRWHQLGWLGARRRPAPTKQGPLRQRRGRMALDSAPKRSAGICSLGLPEESGNRATSCNNFPSACTRQSESRCRPADQATPGEDLVVMPFRSDPSLTKPSPHTWVENVLFILLGQTAGFPLYKCNLRFTLHEAILDEFKNTSHFL